MDCDGDAVLLLVVQKGEACHTSRRSCFTTLPPAFSSDPFLAGDGK
ncbi:hypothetical protein OVX87_28890 [Klebsiella pneumoniae]|nr:hypothetical protein [Klebsiella pneumoniae]